MAKSQILKIEPQSELIFKGPFSNVITTTLQLTNPSQKSVCFKVKTTAPKQYCVRPNSGIIPPNGSVAVAVMLQPLASSTDNFNHAKHKFMVQSVFVPEGELSLENIWKNTTASEFTESKLRVVFDYAEMNGSGNSNYKSILSQPQSSYPPADEAAGLQRRLEENKRLQQRLHVESGDNAKLKDLLRKLESTHKKLHNSTSIDDSLKNELFLTNNIQIKHLAIAVFVGLFLGLIFSRLLL